MLESDGTEVDDDEYLHTLPPQTVFVILQKGEQWQLGKLYNQDESENQVQKKYARLSKSTVFCIIFLYRQTHI